MEEKNIDNNLEKLNDKKPIEETQIIMPQKKKGMSKSARKYLIYIILIVSVTALTLYYLLKEDPKAVFDKLASADIRYVLIFVGLILLYAFIGGLNLMILSKQFNPEYKLHQGVINCLIGQFFSNITPFSSGGQFVQVYTFTRQKIKASNAASVLVMQFILFQSGLLLFAIVAFIIGFQRIIGNLGNVTLLGISFSPLVLSIVGFIINTFTIGSLFLLSFCRPLHRLVLNGGINFLAKLHLIKNPEEKRTNFTIQVASFRVEFKRLISNWKVMLLCFSLVIIRLFVNYSMPYFAAKAVGAAMEGKFMDSVWSSSYLAMITSFIPLPGGSGGAEWGFQSLYLGMIGDNALTYSANILWRGISYYFLTLLGGITFALYRGTPTVSTDKIADTQTFQDLNLTPFIKHRDIKDYDMLEKRYSKMDEKYEKKTEILTNDQVLKSFKRIKRHLKNNDEKLEKEDKLTKKTKKYLKQVIKEAQEIEDSNNDPEIQKAIDGDMAFLNSEREKRRIRKEEKKKKKLEKRNK